LWFFIKNTIYCGKEEVLEVKCPFCDSDDTKVIDKRTSEDGINRRRRECLSCKKRFTTYERIEGSADIKKIKKRNGKIVDFDPGKVTEAIFKAAQAVGGKDRKKAEELAMKVVDYIKKNIQDEIPTVEQVQDIVEKVLIEEGHAKTAKAFILYRQKRTESREQKAFMSKISNVVDSYVNQSDWRVRENSNAGYAISGLQAHISGAVIAEYALEKTYPIEIADAHRNADFHIHDLSLGVFGGYCAGWSLRQLLQEGFNGVPGKVAAKPAKHFDSALGQITNFFGTLQNEWAGAQAFSSFDTYLAPLVKIEKLDIGRVKQGIQEFVFGINQTSRWGNQVPFTNITLDWTVPPDLAEEEVLYGGEKMKGIKYKDCQKEMDMINRAFIEVMMEGDMDGRIFTFPIPTYNITKDFDWDSENTRLLFEMTAKYGTPYFQNFINSSLKPGDVRSMCCRLQLNVKELKNKTGGLFGAGEQTGSIGVVTINLPRIGFLSKTKEEFFERLERLMVLAKKSLEIKRKEVTKNMELGLLPYSRRYLGHFRNHFSTIGLCGMNESCMNFLGKEYNITTQKGREFASEVLDFMREKLKQFQEETGHIYNLEATPAEGTSFRLAKHDKKRFPDIVTQGEEFPYYTNSSQIPVNYTKDIFEALDLQDEIQSKYSGGTVLHGFVGERISDWKVCSKLVKKIAYNYKLPYFTITPTFSICPVHGYIVGEHFTCPHTHNKAQIEKYGHGSDKIECEVFSRVVGYYRPVQNWNDGKKEEFKQRVVFEEKMSMEHEMRNKILESIKKQEIIVEAH
jgi:ribonucleoside-triphosphate reductase